jgi:hypothetical protein
LLDGKTTLNATSPNEIPLADGSLTLLGASTTTNGESSLLSLLKRPSSNMFVKFVVDV